MLRCPSRPTMTRAGALSASCGAAMCAAAESTQARHPGGHERERRRRRAPRLRHPSPSRGGDQSHAAPDPAGTAPALSPGRRWRRMRIADRRATPRLVPPPGSRHRPGPHPHRADPASPAGGPGPRSASAPCHPRRGRGRPGVERLGILPTRGRVADRSHRGIPTCPRRGRPHPLREEGADPAGVMGAAGIQDAPARRPPQPRTFPRAHGPHPQTRIPTRKAQDARQGRRSA